MTEIIDGMPSSDYHAHPALGSTSLKTLAAPGGPAKWKAEQGKATEYVQAFSLGTAAHSLILEQDESQIVEIEAPDWRTKAAKDARDAAVEEGLTPLLTKEIEQVKAMRDAVMANDMARKAFTGHVAEQSMFWDEDGLQLKCRPDARIPGLIVDLKTSADADPSEFGRRAFSLGYYISAAHYIDGVRECTGETLPFVFVQVEKEYPYLVSVVQLDDDAIQWGRVMADRAKRIYRECTAKDVWPGYQPFTTVGLPAWAQYQLEDLTDE
ncbi:MAG: PD-(D/E)XK nuclease-like domain-containing protein [Galactobacter sp.]